jgi:hypothetical protein
MRNESSKTDGKWPKGKRIVACIENDEEKNTNSLGSSLFYIKGKFDVLDSTISDLLWKCARRLCGVPCRLVKLIYIGDSAGDVFIILELDFS